MGIKTWEAQYISQTPTTNSFQTRRPLAHFDTISDKARILALGGPWDTGTVTRVSTAIVVVLGVALWNYMLPWFSNSQNRRPNLLVSFPKRLKGLRKRKRTRIGSAGTSDVEEVEMEQDETETTDTRGQSESLPINNAVADAAERDAVEKRMTDMENMIEQVVELYRVALQERKEGNEQQRQRQQQNVDWLAGKLRESEMEKDLLNIRIEHLEKEGTQTAGYLVATQRALQETLEHRTKLDNEVKVLREELAFQQRRIQQQQQQQLQPSTEQPQQAAAEHRPGSSSSDSEVRTLRRELALSRRREQELHIQFLAAEAKLQAEAARWRGENEALGELVELEREKHDRHMKDQVEPEQEQIIGSSR